MAELLERIEAALDRIDYSARRYYVDKFMAEQIGQVPLSARILDVGGLRTGKRGLFDLEATGRQAVYVNLSAKRAPHVLGSAEALPLAPASFDAVIAAELLEHLQEPKTALVEMAHVLRPEGLLILTVPFLFRIHADPADWARYTETYLRSVLEETGFEAVKIEPQGGFFVQLAELARDYFYRLPPGSG
ncbi:MAG: class I SAM-dependent methyltransferase, partial [Rhodospirillales bacterium]